MSIHFILIFSLFVRWGLAATPIPSSVNEIYSYNCSFRFIEGEGVSSDRVNCLPGQHLGFYDANYSFYLYKSKSTSNFHLRGSSQLYSSSICGLNVRKFMCEANQDKLEFVLASRNEGVFNVPVALSAAPGVAGQTVGYAAMQDSRGQCPKGLVKMRPYLAYPSSIIHPLPSNFINLNGVLNSTRVSLNKPENFKVMRIPAERSCNSSGICSEPKGIAVLSQEAQFVGTSPIVCAIPPSALDQD